MWTAWHVIIGFQRVRRLGDLAEFNSVLFQLFSYCQLALVLFAASLSGASTISYEKDRRTFVLLLVTRLHDWEIIVHKFLAGLLQVAGLLVVALPMFILSLLLGGVSFAQLAQVYGVTIGAAVLSCAFGVLIADWREKTFQSVALTILAVVLSVLVVEVLAELADVRFLTGLSIERWCNCLSPVRAVGAVMRSSMVDEFAIPIVRHPAWGYLATSLLAGAGSLIVATVKLRHWNPRGETIEQREGPIDIEAANRPKSIVHRTRRIWDNPVLWREIQTLAYGQKPILVKLAYGLVLGILVWWLVTAGLSPTTPWKDLIFRGYLPLTLFAVVSLLLVNAQALASITAERDLRSIDLLLVTDITPKEFVYGKLLGILYNAKEMIAGPMFVLAALLFVWRLISPTGLIYSVITFGVFVGFASVLGMHAALRYDSTRIAFANSLLTMFLLLVGILICLFLILVSGRFAFQWTSFVVFIVLGSIGLWVSLQANAPSGAIALTAAIAPFATFYCVIAILQGERTRPFLVGAGVYSFAIAALLIPMLSEFDVATGRTTHAEG
jgi:ABC-type Na+ efflux pump permease subunit